MGKRYNDRQIYTNTSELYEEALEKRNRKSIRHYNTAKLRYPTISEIQKMTKIRHIWKVGDRYYKLAYKYYGATRYWWVIAQFNQRPTEANCQVGDMIMIPMPLEAVLRAFERRD
jgi:hypothetical protein